MVTTRTQDSHTRQNGFALLFSVLTASLVLSVGLAILNLTLKEFVLSSQIRDSQFAFYAADAGLECALYWDLKHPEYAGSIFGFYANSLSNGLVGYWKFDEGDGTTAEDTSGKGNDGVLQNFGSGDWVDGIIGTALDFDNVDNYVRIADDPSLNPEVITVAAWINTSAIGTIDQIITKDDGSAGRMWQFRKASNDTVQFIVFNETTFGQLISASTITDGDWHHVAGTWDGSTMGIFVDGNNEGSVGFSGAFRKNQTNDVLIGRAETASPAYFDGVIDEVRIYDRVLKDNEIADLANLQTSGGFEVPNASGVTCAGNDISAGWDAGGQEVDLGNDAATSTFTVTVDALNNRCAEVQVAKAGGATRIESRGYNSCDTDNPRRIERALRATY
jgi:hypothetical protein